MFQSYKGLVIATLLAMSGATAVMGAKGQTVYKNLDGEFVTKDVSLKGPCCGRKNFLLGTPMGNVESYAHWTKHKNGRMILYVLFLNPPHAPKNTALLLEGSLMKSSQGEKLYFGDVFTRSFTPGTEDELVEKSKRCCLKGYDHLGGYFFYRDAKTWDLEG